MVCADARGKFFLALFQQTGIPDQNNASSFTTLSWANCIVERRIKLGSKLERLLNTLSELHDRYSSLTLFWAMTLFSRARL